MSVIDKKLREQKSCDPCSSFLLYDAYLPLVHSSASSWPALTMYNTSRDIANRPETKLSALTDMHIIDSVANSINFDDDPDPEVT